MTVQAAALRGPLSVVTTPVQVITGNACSACGDRFQPGEPTEPVEDSTGLLVALRRHQGGCTAAEEPGPP